MNWYQIVSWRSKYYNSGLIFCYNSSKYNRGFEWHPQAIHYSALPIASVLSLTDQTILKWSFASLKPYELNHYTEISLVTNGDNVECARGVLFAKLISHRSCRKYFLFFFFIFIIVVSIWKYGIAAIIPMSNEYSYDHYKLKQWYVTEMRPSCVQGRKLLIYKSKRWVLGLKKKIVRCHVMLEEPQPCFLWILVKACLFNSFCLIFHSFLPYFSLFFFSYSEEYKSTPIITKPE